MADYVDSTYALFWGDDVPDLMIRVAQWIQNNSLHLYPDGEGNYVSIASYRDGYLLYLNFAKITEFPG